MCRAHAVALVAALLTPFAVEAQTAYQLPPQEVVDIIDAPVTPELVMSPTRDRMLLVERESHPPIADLARPFLRLAGLRIVPRAAARQRTVRFKGITIRSVEGGVPKVVALAPGSIVTMPVWSADGGRFAFTREADGGPELLVVEAATGVAQRFGVTPNDVLGRPFTFTADSRHLLVRSIPKDRGAAPPDPVVPEGPNVDEAAGKQSKVATYQDLLRSTRDEALFEHFATSQLVLLDVKTGEARDVGAPGLILSAEPSPDESYLLVTRLRRPFSYSVPYDRFSRTIEIWKGGEPIRVLADFPVSDEIPRQGVPTGPRSLEWQPMESAALLWTEALDGGDPVRKVPFREQLFTLAAPFVDKPRPSGTLRQRFQEVTFLPQRGRALVTEYDRDRRWTTTSLVDLAKAKSLKTVFDLSSQDDYANPGEVVMETRANGRRTALADGTSVYLAGEGASERGSYPFLDRLDLGSLKKERLWRSAEGTFEEFVSFAGSRTERRRIVTRFQSPRDPRNYVLVDIRSKVRTKLTDTRDPAPRLAGVKQEILRYERADKVPLSGTLYLPPGYQPGTRLPCLVWAYPLEYSGADTAGQVRGSANTFARPAGTSPLFFLLQGWAVLDDATMPVVGDPETVNETYVEQVTASARAAIDKLDALGVVDRSRVMVGGHSYGAFMTANLLAHTDLFAAGIARSGAYNRTLTPFGFQSERRSYWEATELYTKVSPFTHANRIDEPLLLIHGEADNNPGTFPIQSERLFAAIKGNGGTARLVMLPFEAHGYRARESVLHVLHEMLDWGRRWVAGRKAS